MADTEMASLYGEIESFLRTSTATPVVPEKTTDFSFWHAKTSLSRDEVGMLCRLTGGSLCVNEIAGYLDRDVQSTTALLEALVAIGVLDHEGDRYANTPATHLYCQALNHHWDTREA